MSSASSQCEPFALGIITRLQDSADEALRRVAEFDLPTCQLTTDDPALYTPAKADQVRAASEQHQVTVTTHWAHAARPAGVELLRGAAHTGAGPAGDTRGAAGRAPAGGGLCRMDRRSLHDRAYGVHPRRPERPALSRHSRRPLAARAHLRRSRRSSCGSRPARKRRRRCSARSMTSAPTISASTSTRPTCRPICSSTARQTRSATSSPTRWISSARSSRASTPRTANTPQRAGPLRPRAAS